MPQTTLVQHGDHTDDDLRKRNMDIVSDTRKDDEDRTTKDASLHRPDKDVEKPRTKKKDKGSLRK